MDTKPMLDAVWNAGGIIAFATRAARPSRPCCNHLRPSQSRRPSRPNGTQTYAGMKKSGDTMMNEKRRRLIEQEQCSALKGFQTRRDLT